MRAVRRILHVDMDAFYASVEQRDQPELRGKPLAVGGQPTQRGVVAAASYEARAFGVYSAMPMATAVRLCPSLVIVPPDFARYKAASNAVFSIFREVTPLVEPLSLDEAYLDVTENAWGESFGTAVARRLKERIRADTRLTASAGVAPNKFLAKIASGWKKPDGLTVISPERVEPFLHRPGAVQIANEGGVPVFLLPAPLRFTSSVDDLTAYMDEEVTPEGAMRMAKDIMQNNEKRWAAFEEAHPDTFGANEVAV
jgi:DNA polymerase-4